MTRYVETIDPDLEHTCIHCAGNAGMDAHAPDCPMCTDVWRIGPRELDEGMCCMHCARPFEAGEFYTGEHVLCLGCAALEAGQP